MSLIDRLMGKPDAPSIPPLEIPGDPAANQASGTAGAPSSASAEILAGRKQRSDKGKARGARGAGVSESERALITAFEKLYEPEVWEGVVCAPADTMAALSGRKLWEISPPERKTLSVTASMTARCFAVENPKWLALVMLSITIAQIYGTRAVMHLNEMKREQAAKKQEPRATGESKA